MSSDQKPNTFNSFGATFIVFALLIAAGSIIVLADYALKDSSNWLTKSLPTLIIAIIGGTATLIFNLYTENMSMKNEKYFDGKFDKIQTSIDNKFTEVQLNIDNKFTEAQLNIDNKFTEAQLNIDNKFTEAQLNIDNKFTEVQTQIGEVKLSVTALDEKMDLGFQSLRDLIAPKKDRNSDSKKQTVKP